MEIVSASETSVCFYETKRRSISEGCHLHSRPRDNLKTYDLSVHLVFTPLQYFHHPFFLIYLFLPCFCCAKGGCGSQGSSVSIVSGYGLDDREIEIRFPAEVNIIFPLVSVSRPALGPAQLPVQWVPGSFSPGVKCCRGVPLTTHPI
jgi:hypothetical protein